MTFGGKADSGGVFTIPWLIEVVKSERFEEAVCLLLAGYDWNQALDGEDDSSGNTFPDSSSND